MSESTPLSDLIDRYMPAVWREAEARAEATAEPDGDSEGWGRLMVAPRPGVIRHVPCACGCGELVTVRPQYVSPAHRQRAYRQRSKQEADA